jgi:hypothetical protein
MGILTRDQRSQLSRVVLEAREVAEAAARKALHSLGVDEASPPSHLSIENRALRRALHAQAKQLGDKEDPRKKGSYDLYHLTEKIAYDQWHRMLFARFLAENNLLIAPEHGVPVSLQECRELAPELGLRDEWDVAVRFATTILPQIFRGDDPAGKIELAPEDRTALRDFVTSLPQDVFLADDSLGWVYQFWQSQRKDEVNKSEKKIGADEISPVTQLFTEHYMVEFLLHNTLGAWWVAKRKAEGKDPSLNGIEFTYLRYKEDGTPAAGTFSGWPKQAKGVRVLDPCMGSGHFLVTELPILVAMRMEEEGLSKAEACDAVLRENLFGLEIDARCTQIAAFNLAFGAWKLAGYRPLAPLNLACSGLGINARKDEWLTLADGDERLRRGMEELYHLFQQAPVLGSLIDPKRVGGDLLVAHFHELEPLFVQALRRESTKTDENLVEMAVTAWGLTKAAEILATQFTLVATNVPYLGRGKQEDVLKHYCESFHPDAKTDLATCFVERCIEFCTVCGTAVLVTPQNWFFLSTYKKLRQRLFRTTEWNFAVKLGPAAFQNMNFWAAKTALCALSRKAAEGSSLITGFDVSETRDPSVKATLLLTSPSRIVPQLAQLKNPDCRLLLSEMDNLPLLEKHGTAFQGIATADYSRFGRCFWELPDRSQEWQFQQSTVEATDYFSGREHILLWEEGDGALAKNDQARIQGLEALGKFGVVVSQMNRLPVTLYTGEFFDNNCAALVVREKALWPAVWAYCSSDQFLADVREIDQAVKVTNASLVKVPFDVAYWSKVVAEKYPTGLPKAFSTDPTQWLFGGHPKGSDEPLQVAVARLLGYEWPRHTGSSFPDCPALGPDDLERLADEDGIVCINPIKGEQPAADRLRALLVAAFGAEWTPGKQNELLEQVGFGGKTLEDWLRNGFFEQHCQLFHQRPFMWHIWDGRRDGFSALVNYHKLNRSNLEKLTYTFLGDWITRQKGENEAGKEGSDARLQAAQELKAKLETILEGEAPYDIFVRWKPVEKQPIGWEPDLNDGIRLNVRPFVEAGVLRKNPNINWNKDRGKDVGSAPWYNKYDLKRVPGYKPGDRINEYHLTLEEKRKARNKV